MVLVIMKMLLVKCGIMDEFECHGTICMEVLGNLRASGKRNVMLFLASM